MLKELKPDERIEKESNVLYGKMYYLMSLLMILSLIVKLICKVPWFVYGLELVAFVASGGFLLVQELRKGILFVRKKDEVLAEIHSKNLKDAFMVALWILIVGECLFMNVGGKYFFWMFSYLLIWFIPAIIISIASLSNGWIIWGGKKKEAMGKKRLALGTTLGALAFGIIMGGKFLFRDGASQWTGILWILGMSAFWGVAFYFIMRACIKISEEQADYNAKMAEKKSLEQEGAAHEE